MLQKKNFTLLKLTEHSELNTTTALQAWLPNWHYRSQNLRTNEAENWQKIKSNQLQTKIWFLIKSVTFYFSPVNMIEMYYLLYACIDL